MLNCRRTERCYKHLSYSYKGSLDVKPNKRELVTRVFVGRKHPVRSSLELLSHRLFECHDEPSQAANVSKIENYL